MSEVVRFARGLIGTRFVHQGRTPKGPKTCGAMDCVGLIKVTADGVGAVSKAHGRPLPDRDAYSRIAEDGYLKRLADDHLQPVIASEAKPGDVLLFQFGKVDQHAGIFSTDGRMIHAHDAAGGVVEHLISSAWRRRVSGIYRFIIKKTY